jgi:O-antigen ligase
MLAQSGRGYRLDRGGGVRKFLVGLLPVVFVASVDPSGWSPFGPLRWALVLTFTLALGAAFAHRWTLASIPKPLRLVGLGFLGWMTLATVLSADRWPAWFGTAERHLGLFTWVLFALAMLSGAAFVDDDRRTLAWGCVVAAYLLGAYVLWERVFGPPIALAKGASNRVDGPFGSAVFLAAACLLLAPISFGLARESRAWKRCVATGGGVLALFAMVASGSRGPLVALLGVGVLIVLSRGRRAVVVLIPLGLVLVVASAMINRAAFERSESAARADEWRIGSRAVEQRPLLGVGPEGYRLVFPRLVDDAYVTQYGRAEITDRAHSAPLDVAIIGGLPAGLLYVALLVLIGRRSWRVLRSDSGVLGGLAAGVVAYGVQSLVLFPLADLDPLWWLMIGSLMVEERIAIKHHVAKVMAPALAFCTLVGATIGVLDVAADRASKRALSARMKLDPVGAAGAAHAATRARPDSVRYRVVAARALTTADEVAPLQAALDELRVADRLSPLDPAVIEERARVTAHLAVRTGDATDLTSARVAVDAFVQADPRNPRAWQSLADVARRQGDMAAANSAVARAEELRKKV